MTLGSISVTITTTKLITKKEQTSVIAGRV